MPTPVSARSRSSSATRSTSRRSNGSARSWPRSLAERRLRPGVDHHVLDERVVLERVLAAVLAPTRLLDAAMRGLGRKREVLVDPHVAELERLAHAHRPADVAREDR